MMPCNRTETGSTGKERGADAARGGPRLTLFCLFSLVCFLIASGNVRAEGSYQAGLNQPLYEYGVTSTLLSTVNRPVYVDIINPGEVINISLCGNSDSNQLRVEIRDPLGGLVLNQILSTSTAGVGRVACSDSFTSPLSNPLRYTTTGTGAYEIRLFNNSSDVFRRFDITVTPNSGVLPNPMAASGRLWAYSWAYNAGTYSQSESTDANYYSLTPGGQLGSNFVWLLDLNNFAGYVYEILANSIGVDAPNSGLSVPMTGNSVLPVHPVYLGYPVVAGPLPSATPQTRNFYFVDDEGVDSGISPGVTLGIQDSGTFFFDADVVANYAIVVDINQDSSYGAGDVLLSGLTVAGTNSVVWDGRDNNGNAVPLGDYLARLQVRVGEYHFVAGDAETSGGTEPGLTIYQALPGGGTADTLVYWDDQTVLGGTTTLPAGQLAGHHTWGDFTSNSFGNQRYIDTYVYGDEVSPTDASVSITDNDGPIPPILKVLGSVWSDLNHDGVFDPGEAGIAAVTVVLHDTNAGTCQSVQTDANGDYLFIGVADGSYQIIEAAGEAVPVPASCPVLASDPSGFISSTANLIDIDVAGADIPGQDFGDFPGSRLQGRVFEDNGSGAGVAHDGHINGTEAGLSGVTVAADNGALLDSTTTDADGQFTLWIPDSASGTNVDLQAGTPGSFMSVSKSDGGHGDTALATELDQVNLVPVSGQNYSGINFGDVREPAFAPDHGRSASPGSTLYYPHTFTAYTSGPVSFSAPVLQAMPDMLGWSAVLYEDSNCSGTLEPGEPQHSAAIAMDAEVSAQVCLIVQVHVPSNAPQGAQYAVTVAATFNYSGAPVADTVRIRNDLTTVGSSGLVLVKVVDKPAAQPGEVLTYTITYRNLASAALSDIVIDDKTPAFTTFNGASCVLPLPANLSGCTVATQPSPGGTGAIQWTFNPGVTLQSGVEGQVQYQVTVDN